MKRLLRDLKKYRWYLLYSAKSELRAEVAGSYLNWLWWILDPLLFMLVYTFVVRVVFTSREQYFAAFVLVASRRGISLISLCREALTSFVKIRAWSVRYICRSIC